MDSITRYLSDDHSHCDNLFADAENAVAASDWDTAAQAFTAFKVATLCHFTREEEVLFPAFEGRTGMTGGPTAVMRDEHAQMRDTMDAMVEALAGHGQAAYLSLSETLLMLMRQHNMKEERILYPMADQALDAQKDDLIKDMAAL